mmetsp:Transcript_39130/g.45498  ORF Transcript_39130/g.45498 Transcript_39130/m.45498 type:complete len:287 (+) Transcript_39130:882-1742(+)
MNSVGRVRWAGAKVRIPAGCPLDGWLFHPLNAVAPVHFGIATNVVCSQRDDVCSAGVELRHVAAVTTVWLMLDAVRRRRKADDTVLLGSICCNYWVDLDAERKVVVDERFSATVLVHTNGIATKICVQLFLRNGSLAVTIEDGRVVVPHRQIVNVHVATVALIDKLLERVNVLLYLGVVRIHVAREQLARNVLLHLPAVLRCLNLVTPKNLAENFGLVANVRRLAEWKFVVVVREDLGQGSKRIHVDVHLFVGCVAVRFHRGNVKANPVSQGGHECNKDDARSRSH